jgi:RimJ/RimL family protein N-acetyltransferase
VAGTVVDPPRVRPAGSLDLFHEDLAALRSFRCHAGAGAWYERQAEKALKQAISVLASRALGQRDRVLLFEQDGQLMAVAVFSEESRATAHIGFIGLERDLHGARIDSDDGDRLSDAVLDSTLDAIRDLGFTRATAQVACAHTRSRAMLERIGFQRLSRFNHDYDIHAIDLA